MTGPRIDGRTWRHDGLLHRTLVLEPTVAGDDVVTLWAADPVDGLALHLSPAAADEVADSLRQRAGLLRDTTPDGEMQAAARALVERWAASRETVAEESEYDLAEWILAMREGAS